MFSERINEKMYDGSRSGPVCKCCWEVAFSAKPAS